MLLYALDGSLTLAEWALFTAEPRDPADELIAATSIVHRLPLVTRDKKIRKSKLVPLARL
jgi:predicted nucleic acid-binding protein